MPKGDFADDCVEQILKRLEAGEALTRICKDTPRYPAPSTFLLWCDKDKELAEQYARASLAGYHRKADDALEAAENAEDAAKGRLAFDAARWWLGKRAPKVYGDKTLIGSDPENPLPAGFSVKLVK